MIVGGYRLDKRFLIVMAILTLTLLAMAAMVWEISTWHMVHHLLVSTPDIINHR